MALKIQFTGPAASYFAGKIAAAKAEGKTPAFLIVPKGSMRVGKPGTESYKPEDALLPDNVRIATRKVATFKDGSVKGDGLTPSRAQLGQRYADDVTVNPDGSVTVTVNGGKGAEALRAMLGGKTEMSINYMIDPRPSSKTVGQVAGGEGVCFGGEGPSLGLGASVHVVSDTPEADTVDPWADVPVGKRGGGVMASRAKAALESTAIRFTDVVALKIDRTTLFVGNLAGAKIGFDSTTGAVNALTPTKVAAGKAVEMSAEQIRQAAEAYVAKATEAGTAVDNNWHGLIASVTPAAPAAEAVTDTAAVA